jgi:hypothetical protein
VIWRLKIILELVAFLLLPFGGTAAEFYLWLNGSSDQEEVERG